MRVLMPRLNHRQNDDDGLLCPVCGRFHRNSDAADPSCSGAPADNNDDLDDGEEDEEEEEDEEAEDEFLPCCACQAESIPLWTVPAIETTTDETRKV
jgi:hypothetical protein